MADEKKKKWNIKGLFVQQDESAEEPTAAPVATPTPVATTTSYDSYRTSAPVANPSAFEGQLRECVTGHGSEYTKFKTACDGLRAHLPDENARIKTAFVTMNAMGVTKDRLVSGAKECVGVLNGEKAEFESAMSNAFSSQVEGGMGRLTSIDKQIEEKLTQIGSLQAEADRLRAEKSKISVEVDQSRNKIDGARRDFAAAHAKIVDEINSDINRITSNL